MEEETTQIMIPGRRLSGRPEEVLGWILGDLIGSGAMGFVYLAAARDRLAAVKVVPLPGRHQRTRFRRSVAAHLEVSHPGLLPLWGHEQESDYGFLVTPLLDPNTLSARINRLHGLDFDQAADLLAPIAGALARLHENDWVHRDVKPDNVLFRGSDPVLTDLGLAKRHQSPLADSGYLPLLEEETVENSLCGTPLYMSGQRLHGIPAGPSDDVFAFAMSFVEVLTGEIPDVGPNPSQLRLGRDRVNRPIRLRELPCPSFIQRLVARALSHKSDERPAMSDFEAILS